jgi:D-alanyl-D-alanine carboxypeptidase
MGRMMFWRFSADQRKRTGAIKCFMFCICALFGHVAWSFDTKAKAAYAIDLTSGSVLLSKKL